ncbi:MAG: hypothetical protein QM535_10055 [Limnohabitans sp.]|nr:hypothetical protein [Limnohabitans sp.]
MAIRRITSNRNSIIIKKLRSQKLRAGLPFMINVKELSSNQCYLEYPNGVIKLVTINSTSRDFDVLKELSTSDANNLRKRLNFSL